MTPCERSLLFLPVSKIESRRLNSASSNPLYSATPSAMVLRETKGFAVRISGLRTRAVRTSFDVLPRSSGADVFRESEPNSLGAFPFPLRAGVVGSGSEETAVLLFAADAILAEDLFREEVEVAR